MALSGVGPGVGVSKACFRSSPRTESLTTSSIARPNPRIFHLHLTRTNNHSLFQCRQCQDLVGEQPRAQTSHRGARREEEPRGAGRSHQQGRDREAHLVRVPSGGVRVLCWRRQDGRGHVPRARPLPAAPQTPSHTPLVMPDASGASTPKRKMTMEAPLGAKSSDGSSEETGKKLPSVELSLRPEGVFSTARW